MAQAFANVKRIGRVSIPNDATNVEAGNYTGTDAATGALAGSATNTLSKMKRIKVTATGNTVVNQMRVYRRNSTGPTFTFLFAITIPKWTAITDESRPPWTTGDLFPDISLPTTSDTLAYQLEVAPGCVLLVEEEATDSA